MYADVFSCVWMYRNPAKLLILQDLDTPFHAVNSGSNPLGDANKIKGLRHILRKPFFLSPHVSPHALSKSIVIRVAASGRSNPEESHD